MWNDHHGRTAASYNVRKAATEIVIVKNVWVPARGGYRERRACVSRHDCDELQADTAAACSEHIECVREGFSFAGARERRGGRRRGGFDGFVTTPRNAGKPNDDEGEAPIPVGPAWEFTTDSVGEAGRPQSSFKATQVQEYFVRADLATACANEPYRRTLGACEDRLPWSGQ